MVNGEDLEAIRRHETPGFVAGRARYIKLRAHYTSQYNPLHHIEVLTVERTVTLVQAGDSLFVATADGRLVQLKCRASDPPRQVSAVKCCK